jgi:ribosomal-protein-alanine N-acetyltransferase
VEASKLDEFQPQLHLPLSLGGHRVIIRRWRISDMNEHEALFDTNAAEHLAPWLPPQPTPRTPTEKRNWARDRINLGLERWEEGTDYRFFIVRKIDEKIVGQIGVTGVLRNVNQSAFIGYWVGKEYTGHGYATEATRLAMQFGFEYLRLHRITLWISPANLASLRVAEKLQLRHEGQIKGALFLGGQWQDTEIYAITSEEWKERLGKSG